MLAIAAIAPAAWAQITVPNADGSDGALNFTTGTNVINLANAVAGSWTSPSATPGSGTYDSNQWAIVFKYTSVNIASNTTMVFSNHYSRAPVVWLVSGNVTINGTLSLDGQPGSAGSGEFDPPEPGPGGFRGGAGSIAYGAGGGFGPGAVSGNGQYLNYPYGTTNIVPLIGGSGGTGSSGFSGGGAGGAILIAATGSITVNGSCHANGGSANGGYYGSGGAIRLVANQISGSGQLLAYNSTPGRIRMEANTVTGTLVANPATVAVNPATPALIFPAATAPTVTIVSVGGAASPADPRAQMTATPGGDDISIATTSNTVPVLVQTQNFPTNGTVKVYVHPRDGNGNTYTASLVSSNSGVATWQALAAIPYPPSNPGHSVIQVRAVLP